MKASNMIKMLRKQRGLTLQALADAIGTSNQQISRLEQGKIRLTVDWMDKIAAALGCEMADLLPDVTQSAILYKSSKNTFPDLSELHPAEALANFDIDLLAQAMEMVDEQAHKFGLGKRARAENLILTYMILLRDRADATRPAKPTKMQEKQAKKA